MSTCSICHGEVFDARDLVLCPVCNSAYHRDCWDYNYDRCAILNCPGEGLPFTPELATETKSNYWNESDEHSGETNRGNYPVLTIVFSGCIIILCCCISCAAINLILPVIKRLLGISQ